ncbi:uncharacterized protein LOC128125832 isoform X2 [Lactuca sativa]|uniref:uncharacterized protein LOC128125832 isoform X2 n=1 Tax=Lactuca sativa TaxID=4236 RepID=UPI000CD9D7B7|nr:uncharacterized protein LOC128125832 isoform X2 [Lactuca sativa]
MANNTQQVPRVLVNRVSEQAVFPCGGIISSAKTITLQGWNRTLVPTDLRFIIPAGVCLHIVNQGYMCGPCSDALVWVDMYNRSGSPFKLKAGDHIAWLDVLHNKITPKLIDVTPLFNNQPTSYN